MTLINMSFKRKRLDLKTKADDALIFETVFKQCLMVDEVCAGMNFNGILKTASVDKLQTFYDCLANNNHHYNNTAQKLQICVKEAHPLLGDINCVISKLEYTKNKLVDELMGCAKIEYSYRKGRDGVDIKKLLNYVDIIAAEHETSMKT